MDPFEYLVTLISVLVGLAIADLATSVHLLLRARHRVRWDWMPLGAALLALLALLNFWWVLFAGGLADYDRIGGFLPLAAQLLILFLLNAAALPDDVPADGLDLRGFYEGNRRYFWGLYAGYILFIMIGSIITLITYTDAPILQAILGPLLSPNTVILLSFLALAISRRRWLHGAVIIAWLAFLLSIWWDLRLAAPDA